MKFMDCDEVWPFKSPLSKKETVTSPIVTSSTETVSEISVEEEHAKIDEANCLMLTVYG